MKRVDPKVYTKDYYLNDCTGFNEFKKSFGKVLEPRFVELIKLFNINSGTKVLDVGCGRGEMVFYAAGKGARAIGIDYSNDSIDLAKLAQGKQQKDIQNRTEFIQMDAKKLKFRNSDFDLIIMTDVVEHLYPEELDLVFGEIKRVLKPGGILVIHTAPNKIFNDVAYKYYCYPVGSFIVFVWNKTTRKNYPNMASIRHIRTDSHRIMHINEPTYFSLSKLYKKFNFQGRLVSTNITVKKPSLSLKDKVFNLLVFFHPLSKYFPLNILFGSDFVSILTNEK
jgi:ubiquinone/menaquinone biosynthesis C-methylase UbiE